MDSDLGKVVTKTSRTLKAKIYIKKRGMKNDKLKTLKDRASHLDGLPSNFKLMNREILKVI
jgi:hypothetical protein